MAIATPNPDLEPLRDRLSCNFEQIDELFEPCVSDCLRRLGTAVTHRYLDSASRICSLGRGAEPVLIFLEEMPELAESLGADCLEAVAETAWQMSRNANGRSVPAFLQSLGAVGRRLGSLEQLQHYLELVLELMRRTSGSIHGNQNATLPSPGLPHFLQQAPQLLNLLSIQGLRSWLEYGIRNYYDHPERQQDYFALQSSDSRAILQRERQGTLFMDHERELDLTLRALWNNSQHLVPYSEAWDQLRRPQPYYDAHGIRVPDCYEDAGEVSGIDRYRALLAHISAHQRWSQPLVADNYSPFQRLAIELFEDCRVERLAMQRFPGLRRLWLSLHPKPGEGDCNPQVESCIRHRLTCLSYALLNPDHDYRDPDLLEFADRFHQLLERPDHSTAEVASIALSYIARTRRQEDLSAKVHFENTVIDYRDDNRHLWRFIEEGDEEESFEEQRKLPPDEQQSDGLPPRHYPEWDYRSRTYRPDWVSLYESLHPPGNSAEIDSMLARHQGLARQLKQLLDRLKPQQHVRLRYQEEGSELDLDIALRSLIELRSGHNPDPRINMSQKHDGRDIAVTLLLDLSESLNQPLPNGQQTLLQLSQESVALLGWAVDQLGDSFAISGFSSNGRHEVRYQHIKGFGEGWDERVKSRLAAIEAGWSTRMGAPLRHAGNTLASRSAEKKLLLVLTDGEPADIDESDHRLLIEDSRRAVVELERQGIFCYCISLDPRADEYVRDIFGNRYSVIDRVERLPEQLPQLFLSLTR